MGSRGFYTPTMAHDVDDYIHDTPPTTNLSASHDPCSRHRQTNTMAKLETLKTKKKYQKHRFSNNNANTASDLPTHPPAPPSTCLQTTN
jgi:hypothetical protein